MFLNTSYVNVKNPLRQINLKNKKVWVHLELL